jgi:GTP-binding protein
MPGAGWSTPSNSKSAVSETRHQGKAPKICRTSPQKPRAFSRAPVSCDNNDVHINVKYLLSAVDPAHFPPAGPPEVAFIGRSNVGKSSLLNALVRHKIAKTSSTPGRTRAINFFEVQRPGRSHPDFLFVDLPGYGYAKVSKKESSRWPLFVEPYLAEREPLSLCLVLVDSRIPPQASDKGMIEWLAQLGRPFLVVGTKADQLGNKLQTALRTFQTEFGVESVLPFSARTGKGRDELWRAIESAARQV